jgi:hypothetical protein
MLDEIGQDIKDFTLQLDRSASASQFVELFIQFIVAKDVAHGEGNIPRAAEKKQEGLKL